MKQAKKIIAMILAIVVFAALVTACNSKNDNNVSSSNNNSNVSSSDNSSNTSTSPQESTPAIIVQAPPSASDKPIKYAEEFTYITESGIAAINVHSTAGHGPGNTHTYRAISDTLLYMEMDGTLVPMLATSYETEDYITWVFHLRDDVYFHNGDKFTAKDVIYTWSSALDKLGSPAIDNWAYVKEMTALDDYTVEFVLNNPFIDFKFNMSAAQAIILNERAIAEDPEKGYWVGTGAFKVVEFVSGDYVVFERNEDYWAGLPPTKRMKWWYVPEASSRTIMIQTGEAQMVMSLPMNDFDLFMNKPEYGFMPITQQNSVIIAFNLDDPICGDLNFRKAVAYAIDTEELAILARGAHYELQDDGAVWGLTTPYRNTNIPKLERDLDKAKEFLEASNYDSSVIEYTSSGGGGEVLQAQLAQIGIKLELNVMDMASFSAYTAYGNNQAQMIGGPALISATPGSGYRMNFNPGMGNNKYQYNNPVFTEKLADAMSTPDGDDRRDKFFELQEIIDNDIPCIPLYYARSNIVSVKGFGGIAVTASMAIDFRFAYWILDD